MLHCIIAGADYTTTVKAGERSSASGFLRTYTAARSSVAAGREPAATHSGGAALHSNYTATTQKGDATSERNAA